MTAASYGPRIVKLVDGVMRPIDDDIDDIDDHPDYRKARRAAKEKFQGNPSARGGLRSRARRAEKTVTLNNGSSSTGAQSGASDRAIAANTRTLTDLTGEVRRLARLIENQQGSASSRWGSKS